jgi:hypothetical protein
MLFHLQNLWRFFHGSLSRASRRAPVTREKAIIR